MILLSLNDNETCIFLFNIFIINFIGKIKSV